MRYKMTIIVSILGILVVIFIFFGCSIPYPAEKQAFIPRFLDSEYEDFKKFAKQETDRILYARPIPEQEREKYIKQEYHLSVKIDKYKIANNKMISIYYIYDENVKCIYAYISGFGYYGGWRKWTFNFFILPNTTQKIYIYPIAQKNIEYVKQMALENSKTIGDFIENNKTERINNIKNKPAYLESIDVNYKDFRSIQ